MSSGWPNLAKAATQFRKTRPIERAKLTRDFHEFCRGVRIKTKSEGLVRFDPARWHDEQKRFDAERTGRDIVLKPRQIGFSTLELVRGLHESLTREAWNTQVVIHDSELADELFDVVHVAAFDISDTVSPSKNRVRFLQFPHTRSTISVTEAGATERTATKKGRSGTIHRLHATEVAFWNEPTKSMAGLLGAVPDDVGEVLLESTPNGSSGWFYDHVIAARDGESPYKFHFFPWWQHARYRRELEPGFDPEPRNDTEEKLLSYGCDDAQLAWWRNKVAALTLDVALAEFPSDPETCFRAGGGNWFEQELLDARAADVRDPVDEMEVAHDGRRIGTLLVYEHPNPNREYILAADFSEGKGRDGHSLVVIARDSGAVVATLSDDRCKEGEFGLACASVAAGYNDALAAPERNHGHAAIYAMTATARYEHIYQTGDGDLGFLMSPATRPVVWDDGHRIVKSGSIPICDRGIYEEMKNLVRGPNGRPQARNKGSADGARDDKWTAWIIAQHVRATTQSERVDAQPSGTQRLFARNDRLFAGRARRT